MASLESHRVGAIAVVRLTVEVSQCGSWDHDCSIEQVERQATESALCYIIQRTQADQRLQIVGKPVVTTVITKREDR